MAPMAPEELERIIQERMGLVNKEQEQEELFEKQRRQQMQMEMEMVQQQQHLQEERFEQNKMEVEFSHQQQQQQQQQQHHQQQQQQQMDEVGKSLLEAVKSKKNSRGIHESTKLPYSQHHTYFLLPLKLCRSVRQIMSYFSRVVLGY
jgi:aspartate oxidase